MQQPNKTIGRHLIADLSGIEAAMLCDAERVCATLADSLRKAGFTVLGEKTHIFEGGGFTAVILLSESHASIHTYPELGYAAFDLFSCGDREPTPVFDAMVALLKPTKVSQQIMLRTKP